MKLTLGDAGLTQGWNVLGQSDEYQTTGSGLDWRASVDEVKDGQTPTVSHPDQARRWPGPGFALLLLYYLAQGLHHLLPEARPQGQGSLLTEEGTREADSCSSLISGARFPPATPPQDPGV
ncbi:uncharacterized protein LOC115899133 [Rhinopithecus roxellana]|uniref:uncharacterized protein LOC115899133 n=1 Tax=Rhinopithecus roxellana TaxID=61622 RepID=UPI0012376463|nr:uncharacterized protein LOC115899133 [Rhinopithecus roxellana]